MTTPVGFTNGEVIFSPEMQSLSPVVFSQQEGAAWAKECVAKHPEIRWLADANVQKTQEGTASETAPYSSQLFNGKFDEFDRTLMTLHCLRLGLRGTPQAYEKFTSSQPHEVRLSEKSFQELHLERLSLLKSQWKGMTEEQMAQAMETALVLGDMGKSQQARELFKPYKVTAPDHDDFYGEAMQVLSKEPQLSTSFSRLPQELQELLLKTSDLGHYGHMSHLEGGPSMFDKLKKSNIINTDPVAFRFSRVSHKDDVSGALGHVNKTSSLVYTELTHKTQKAMDEALLLLHDPKTTTQDVYNAYLAKRAAWLGLNPTDAEDRVLTRIGAMMRLFTPEEGAVLKQAMNALPLHEREQIIAGLDVEKGEWLLRTPTYMPAVLVNLLNNSQLGKTKEERLAKAISLGLPCICRVLALHKEQLAKKQADPNVPLNFNTIAGIAKSHPERLAQSCIIDANGNVILFVRNKVTNSA